MRHQIRAVLSILRNPVRILIVTLVISVLSSFLVGSFLIREASGNVRKAFISSVAPIVTLSNTNEENVYGSAWYNTSHNRQQMYEEYLKDIKRLSENTRVRKTDYSIYLRTYTDCLHSDTENWNNYFPFDSNSFYGSFFYQFICGINLPEFTALANNSINIISGRAITGREITDGSLVCLVNENLKIDDHGSKRDIKPGDMIPLSLYSFYSDERKNEESVENVYEKQTVYLEVVGIFHSNNSIINQRDGGFEKRESIIYVPNPVVENIYQMNLVMIRSLPEKSVDAELMITPGITDVFFQVNDEEDLSYFLPYCQGLEEKYYRTNEHGKKETLMITESTTDAYDKVAFVIIQLGMISESVIYVISLIFAVLLTLIIVINLNNRKKEIGILMALGEKKGRIIRQVLTEYLIICFLGYSLSLGLGVYLAEPISREMMETYISKQDDTKSTDDRGNQIIRFIDIDEDKLTELFEIRISGRNILYITTLEYGILITCLAVSIIIITRVNPKKMLLG